MWSPSIGTRDGLAPSGGWCWQWSFGASLADCTKLCSRKTLIKVIFQMPKLAATFYEPHSWLFFISDGCPKRSCWLSFYLQACHFSAVNNNLRASSSHLHRTFARGVSPILSEWRQSAMRLIVWEGTCSMGVNYSPIMTTRRLLYGPVP